MNHLPAFGWEPIVLMVDEKYYEEKLDWNLVKILPPTLKVEKATAFGITKPRIIGDIGIRGFWQLLKKARQIIEQGGVDFLYIPIPSFYVSLLGRILHRQTGVPYGIDYIDPWVHKFPGSDRLFSRHWFSTKVASLLEPIAIKKASLITGVAKGYYEEVLKRNPAVAENVVSGAMPYGGEQADHDAVSRINMQPYLFDKKQGKTQLVYAGAMLPKAYQPLKAIFKAIAANKLLFEKLEIHFIGTGKTPTDPNGFNIKSLAEDANLWQTVVFEYPQRIPYLDVLVHLDTADGVFVLGSTEPHYTPSKLYQAVLSQKPVLAVLHQESTAVDVLQRSGAGVALTMAGENDMNSVEERFPDLYNRYKLFMERFNFEQINLESFEKYSAKNVTATLAGLLDHALTHQP